MSPRPSTKGYPYKVAFFVKKVIKEQIQQIRLNIEKIKAKVKIDTDVCIVGATKTRSIDAIKQLLTCGIDTVGENKAQELVQKYMPIDGLKWHFIGTLQRNKVKYIVDKVDMIQSVDSLDLANEIDKRCRTINKVMPILVEVNIGCEAQKSGVAKAELLALLTSITQMHNVQLCGLMTVMPIGAQRILYQQMKQLFDDMSSKLNLSTFATLSMGMTDDYEIAVECGSNMIRLGRSIFGDRIYE